MSYNTGISTYVWILTDKREKALASNISDVGRADVRAVDKRLPPTADGHPITDTLVSLRCPTTTSS